MSKTEALIAAIRARGSDARDLRDAAHEACHAIEANVPDGKWDREGIHSRLIRGRSRSDLVRLEIEARAVEQLVCADLGVDCDTVDKWAEITWWETMKNMRINLPSVEWIAKAVNLAMKQGRIRDKTDAVVALADKPVKTRARKSRQAVTP